MTMQHPGGAAVRADFMTAANPTTRPRLRGFLLVGFVLVGLTALALALAVYFGARFGVVAVVICVLAAALPLLFVVPTFLWLDRFENEPTHYLLTAFFWGAIAAVAIALVLNTSAIYVLYGVTGDPERSLSLGAIVVAPLVEEAAKAAIVVFVWWLRRREFDGITDGIVYAGLSAAGFAFTENIQYLAHAFTTQDGQFGLVFFMRCLMSPFAHPMFTICTGVGIGIAATSRSGLVKVLAPLGGYVLACLAHGLWNLSATIATSSGDSLFLVIYLCVEVPLFLSFIAFVVWARRHEGRLIGQFLRPYADAGWLSAPEVQMLSSMARRRQARAWARTNGGRDALRSMRAFQDTASELALLRRRMYHDAGDARAAADERLLLDNLTARRREFAGMPGQ